MGVGKERWTVSVPHRTFLALSLGRRGQLRPWNPERATSHLWVALAIEFRCIFRVTKEGAMVG